MNFDLGPDEIALRDGIRDLCGGVFPMERVRKGIDREGWRALSDAGVFTLRVDESKGGVGLGMTAAVVVFEELGRSLVPGPLVDTHVARGLGITDEIVVLHERGDTLIEHLESADLVLVLDDNQLLAVSPEEIDAEPIDRPLDPLTPLRHVKRVPEGRRVDAAAAWVRRECSLLTAALLSGIASRTTELATAYAKERRQFGRVIGSFQAVKHICADMLVRAEMARAAVDAAGVAVDRAASDDPSRAIASAKLVAIEAALHNAKASIQVHGGMGYTWEVDAHLYLKRAATLATRFGSADSSALAVASSLV